MNILLRNMLLPGLIDIHVHLRSPGQTHKEDFITGTKAALAGGFTTILDMPNNIVPITLKRLLDEKINLAKKNILCDVGFYFGSQGENVGEFEKVKNEVFGIKLYLNKTTGNFLINTSSLGKIFETWPKNCGPILVHAEDNTIEEVLKHAAKTEKPTHFCHISLASDLIQISNAKKRGLPITCGVTPHHLFLNSEDAKKLKSFGRMKPDLKKADDVSYLWEHLHEIDVIESDHAPHTKEEKEKPINTSPYGIPELESTLPLLLTACHKKMLKMDDIIRLCYENPKKIFHIPNQNSSIEVNLEEKYILEESNLFTKCAWSPFSGWQMQGKVKKVTIRGNTVYENGKILARPGSGQIIKPQA